MAESVLDIVVRSVNIFNYSSYFNIQHIVNLFHFKQVALYSFSASNDQELSFEKGDRLEIVERPAADPEWYRARNGQGHVGLVPRNYLQELSEYLTQPYT